MAADIVTERWEAEAWNDGFEIVLRGKSCLADPIAVIKPRWGDDDNPQEDAARRARAASAAPQMLDCLERLALSRVHMLSHAQSTALWAEVDEAIAKARGMVK